LTVPNSHPKVNQGLSLLFRPINHQ